MTIDKTAFERWAMFHSYDIAPADFPSEFRQYADGQTQAAFLAWTAGVASVASADITNTTRETFIEQVLAFTVRNAVPAEVRFSGTVSGETWNRPMCRSQPLHWQN